MKRNRRRLQPLAAVLIAALSIPAALADITIYPSKGQSADKQSKDKYECYDWAKKQTGFDPQQAAGTAAPQQGHVARGAGRGAAAGAVGGAIGGDAGKGAAIGAGVGAVAGGSRRRQEKKAQEQQAGIAQEKQVKFDKAQTACLEGRGYSVK